MPGLFSPPPNSKKTSSLRSRHASRHLRHALAVMHVGIANPRRRGKRSLRMRNPQFYVSGKRPILWTLMSRMNAGWQQDEWIMYWWDIIHTLEWSPVLLIDIEVVSKISCLILVQVLWFKALYLYLENQSKFTMSDYRESVNVYPSWALDDEFMAWAHFPHYCHLWGETTGDFVSNILMLFIIQANVKWKICKPGCDRLNNYFTILHLSSAKTISI